MDIESVNPRLLAGHDAVSDGRPRAAGVQLFGRLDHRVEVAAVAQENLQLFGVAGNDLFGKTRAGLGQVYPRAQLIFGNRRAGGGVRSNLTSPICTWRLNHKTQTQRSAPRARLEHFHARIRHSLGIEQGLQRIADADRREFGVGQDSDNRKELCLGSRIGRRALETNFNCD